MKPAPCACPEQYKESQNEQQSRYAQADNENDNETFLHRVNNESVSDSKWDDYREQQYKYSFPLHSRRFSDAFGRKRI
jgi:hypothetical protein